MTSGPAARLVYRATVEGLFLKALNGRLDSATRAELAAVGVDLGRPLHAAYAVEELDEAFAVLARRVFPELSTAQAFRRLGELQVEGFQQSVVGAATLRLMRLFNRRQLVERVGKSWRSANNFVTVEVAAEGADAYTLRVNDVGRHPEMYQGIMEAVLRACGRAGTIGVRESRGRGCLYEVRFGEAGL